MKQEKIQYTNKPHCKKQHTVEVLYGKDWIVSSEAGWDKAGEEISSLDKYGAATKSRTRDLLITSQYLSRS